PPCRLPARAAAARRPVRWSRSRRREAPRRTLLNDNARRKAGVVVDYGRGANGRAESGWRVAGANRICYGLAHFSAFQHPMTTNLDHRADPPAWSLVGFKLGLRLALPVLPGLIAFGLAVGATAASRRRRV